MKISFPRYVTRISHNKFRVIFAQHGRYKTWSLSVVYCEWYALMGSIEI